MRDDADVDALLDWARAQPMPVPPGLLARVEADAVRLQPVRAARPVRRGRPAWRWPRWPQWAGGGGAALAAMATLAWFVPVETGVDAAAWEDLELWAWEADVHDAFFGAS